MKLTVATCQFPLSSDIRNNLWYVRRQILAGARRGADVAHFPEGCLSGYAGVDVTSHEGLDWPLLEDCVRAVMAMAREKRIWVVLGSAHRLTAPHKPHNSLYIIGDRGDIVDRYDKRFCAGDESGETGDLAHYSPGDHASILEIRGVRCGALICHEYRYPELYREYARSHVRVVFHSFHAGNVSPERLASMQDQVGRENHGFNHEKTIPGITMPATMVAEAANNHLWISCPNSSARESLWPSFMVRPDGVVTGRLQRHRPGVLISEIDTNAPVYDSTAAWRDRAVDGVLHSGTLVQDERSAARTRL